ncbi:hypothetical protein [Streptomyces werraensis]|uniref:hypothetical protein n=1 Tax=Streptomyces werraensis TaxID=68284 RepID=UPI00343D117D
MGSEESRQVPDESTREADRERWRSAAAGRLAWRQMEWPLLLLALSAMWFAAGVPLTFYVWDDDSLRMTDDYAAIIGGLTVGAFVVSFFEVHFVTQGVQLSVDRKGASLRWRVSEMRFFNCLLAVYLCVWLAQLTSLSLVALWASIENHGPATWLAWYSWITAGYSLTLLFVSGVSRIVFFLVRLDPRE